MSKQVVTVGYMKQFTDGVLEIKTSEYDDSYCPTYVQITNGSIFDVWQEGERIDDFVNGVLVDGYSVGDSSTSYASNQLVDRGDLKLKYISLDRIEATLSSGNVSCCGADVVVNVTAMFNEYSKEEGSSPSLIGTYSDSSIQFNSVSDQSWASVDTSIASSSHTITCAKNEISETGSALERSAVITNTFTYNGVQQSVSVTLVQASNTRSEEITRVQVWEVGTRNSRFDVSYQESLIELEMVYWALVSDECGETSPTYVTGHVKPTSSSTIPSWLSARTYNDGYIDLKVFTNSSCEERSERIVFYYGELYSYIDIEQAKGGITISGPSQVLPYAEYQYSAVCSDGTTPSNVTWSCGSGGMISENGVLYAWSSCYIYVSGNCGYGCTSAETYVDVDSSSLDISVQSPIGTGQSVQATASCSDGSSVGTVTWESSSPSIFTVSSNGRVNGVSPGSAFLYATGSCGVGFAYIEVTGSTPPTSCTQTGTSYELICGSVSVAASATTADIPFTGVTITKYSNCPDSSSYTYSDSRVSITQNTSTSPRTLTREVSWNGETCNGTIYQAASGSSCTPSTSYTVSNVVLNPSVLDWDSTYFGYEGTCTTSITNSDCSESVTSDTHRATISNIPPNETSSDKELRYTLPIGQCSSSITITQRGKPMPACIVNSIRCSPLSADLVNGTAQTQVNITSTGSGCDTWTASNGARGSSGDYLVVNAAGTYTISASSNPLLTVSFTANDSPSYDAIVYLSVNVRNNGGVPTPYVNVGAITASTSLSLSIEGSVNGRAFSIRVENASSQGQDFCGNFDTPIPSFDDIKYGQIENLDYFNVSLSNADIHLSSGSIQDDTPPC